MSLKVIHILWRTFLWKKKFFPEKTLLYVNQAFLTVKKNKKFFYWDYFVLGQIVESFTPLDIFSYALKQNEVKMVRPSYDWERGKFGGFYETIGFLVVGGSPLEVFLKYGYDKEKLKLLHSHYRRKTPNSFSGTIFNCHRSMIESGEVVSEMSNIFFFLRSITDRSEEINKYLNNVSISPIDITQCLGWNSVWSFEAWHLWHWEKYHIQ